MSEKAKRALLSAAASSAMEGIPVSSENMKIIESIMNGEMTLQEYIDSARAMYGEP